MHSRRLFWRDNWKHTSAYFCTLLRDRQGARVSAFLEFFWTSPSLKASIKRRCFLELLVCVKVQRQQHVCQSSLTKIKHRISKKTYNVIMFDGIDTTAFLSFRGCILLTLTNLTLLGYELHGFELSNSMRARSN